MIAFELPDLMYYILASCQSDEECSLTEKCLQGQCNTPCDQRYACGMNAECRVFSHNKQCSCPPGFTGNQDVECMRSKYCIGYLTLLQNISYSSMQNIYIIFILCYSISVPVSCKSDLDCSEGNTCRDNMCLPVCHTDQECAFNEKCLKGNCICKYSNMCLCTVCECVCLYNTYIVNILSIKEFLQPNLLLPQIF
jgi:hypothetical protein